MTGIRIARSLEEVGLVIAPDLRCRVFSDGIAIYIAETCETHVLPAAYGRFMSTVIGPTTACGVRAATEAADGSTLIADLLSDDAVEQLVTLGIFRRVAS